MRALLAVACMGAACLLATPARAEASESSLRASERFTEGRDAMKRGDYPLARLKLTESLELDPSLGTLLNLAVCEQRLGHLLRAQALVQQFLDSAAPDDDRRMSAVQLATDITAKLTFLTVNIEPSELAETSLDVDGHEQRFLSGTAFSLEPGQHLIELGAVGFSRQRVTITLAEGEHHALTFVLRSQVAADSSQQSVRTPHTPPRPATGRSPAFYVALSAGLVGTATIAGSFFMIARERSIVREHCTDKSCDPLGLAAGDRGKAWVMVNTVAWPVALAGASLAAYFVLFQDKHSKQQYRVSLAANPTQPSLFFEGRLW